MKKNLLLLGLILLIAGAGYALVGSLSQSAPVVPAYSRTTPVASKPTPEIVDYQASFGVFTNGTFRIFTDSKYHNQSEDVFIEADNHNIIQIKKSGVTWDDFFKTLPMKLTKDCLTTGTGQLFCGSDQAKLKFYINGREEPDALDRQIKSGDKLLVSYGSETEERIRLQMQQIPKSK